MGMDDSIEDIMTCVEVFDHIEKQEQHGTALWKHERIASHQGPLKHDDPDCNGSACNVWTEWEDRPLLHKPPKVVVADNPVTCVMCAKDNGLFGTPGWKQFKRLAKCTKKFIWAIGQAKLHSWNTAPMHKHGSEVPKNCDDAARLGQINDSAKWQDAAKLELKQLNEHNTSRHMEGQSHQGANRSRHT